MLPDPPFGTDAQNELSPPTFNLGYKTDKAVRKGHLLMEKRQVQATSIDVQPASTITTAPAAVTTIEVSITSSSHEATIAAEETIMDVPRTTIPNAVTTRIARPIITSHISASSRPIISSTRLVPSQSDLHQITNFPTALTTPSISSVTENQLSGMDPIVKTAFFGSIVVVLIAVLIMGVFVGIRKRRARDPAPQQKISSRFLDFDTWVEAR
jgi:hypothetical protein